MEQYMDYQWYHALKPQNNTGILRHPSASKNSTSLLLRTKIMKEGVWLNEDTQPLQQLDHL